jgi:predicted nucleic acid-binding protein
VGGKRDKEVSSRSTPKPFSTVPEPADHGKKFILDSSAILRFLDREAGYDRVEDILLARAHGFADVIVISVHWGEVALRLFRRSGKSVQQSAMAEFLLMGIELVPATAERAVRAALIRARLEIPYVDAFGVELAGESAAHVFVTADFDLKPAAHEVKIEFLPAK